MAIIFDGLDGAFKTSLIKKQDFLFKKNVSFFKTNYDFSNGFLNNIKDQINAIKDDCEVIESSLIKTLLILQFLTNYDYINKKDFFKYEKLLLKNMHHERAMLHILLVCDYKTILENRVKQNQVFTYLPNFKHAKQLDNFLNENLIKTYDKFNVIYRDFNITKNDEVEELKKLTNSLFNR